VPTFADTKFSIGGFREILGTAAPGHDRSFNPQKRSAFERLLSGFILRIGMLAPLTGVGGIAATQYFPCRKSAFSDRAAVSNKSIAGWRPTRAVQGNVASMADICFERTDVVGLNW